MRGQCHGGMCEGHSKLGQRKWKWDEDCNDASYILAHLLFYEENGTTHLCYNCDAF